MGVQSLLMRHWRSCHCVILRRDALDCWTSLRCTCGELALILGCACSSVRCNCGDLRPWRRVEFKWGLCARRSARCRGWMCLSAPWSSGHDSDVLAQSYACESAKPWLTAASLVNDLWRRVVQTARGKVEVRICGCGRPLESRACQVVAHPGGGPWHDIVSLR